MSNKGEYMRNRIARLAAEAGEGVISAAIAVLVMAFLGVAMWVAFNGIFNNAATKINDQIENIGQ
jgi:hypothetical protein